MERNYVIVTAVASTRCHMYTCSILYYCVTFTIKDIDGPRNERIVHWEFARCLSIESKGKPCLMWPVVAVGGAIYLVVLDLLRLWRAKIWSAG